MTYDHYSLENVGQGEDGHDLIVLHLGKREQGGPEIELCGMCLATRILEQSFCCAEHALPELKETWERPNRAERRSKK